MSLVVFNNFSFQNNTFSSRSVRFSFLQRNRLTEFMEFHPQPSIESLFAGLRIDGDRRHRTPRSFFVSPMNTPTEDKEAKVFGASGYLGSRLCRELFNSGHHVKAFVRRTSDVSSLPPPTDGGSSGGTLELVYGDVTDYQSLVQACSGCHVIFHAAALVEHWLPDPSRFIAVNVGGLKNVLQAYKETGTIEKIVYTSSFFALGPTDGYVADESQFHPGKFFTTEYEKSKAVADKVALDAVSEGVPIVLAYPGVVYGGGKVTTANTVANMLVERFNGRLPGYIGQAKERFSFSHVDDVVNGHISAMDKGKPGERYLFTGQNASWKEVFDIAAMITQTKKPSFGIPIFILVFYGWMSVLLAKITGKIPLVSPPMVRMIKHQWAYSCDKAKEELGYHPRSLEEGLSEVLPWLKSSGSIKY